MINFHLYTRTTTYNKLLQKHKYLEEQYKRLLEIVSEALKGHISIKELTELEPSPPPSMVYTVNSKTQYTNLLRMLATSHEDILVQIITNAVLSDIRELNGGGDE